MEEDEGEGFVCVEVLDTNPGPVFNDLRVRIATADGTALGIYTNISYYLFELGFSCSSYYSIKYVSVR